MDFKNNKAAFVSLGIWKSGYDIRMNWKKGKKKLLLEV